MTEFRDMRVLLQQDIPSLGKAGEIKEVKDGYARNYLIPRKLATFATQSAIERTQHDSRKATECRREKQTALQDLAKTIQKTALRFKRKATSDGRLYGGIHVQDIVMSLRDKNIEIVKEAVHLPEALKTIGSHTVELRLPHGIDAVLKVEITAIE